MLIRWVTRDQDLCCQGNKTVTL